MIDIENKSYKPDIDELCDFVGNSLFSKLCSYMDSEYKAIKRVEFSGEKMFLGWNLKFKKGGRTLCTVYPRLGHFFMLVVVGKKEKERVEALLPYLSAEFRDIYNNTKEGMGQRWLMIDFKTACPVFDDAMEVVRIRRIGK